MDSTESVITTILSYVVQPTEFWNEQLPNRSMLRNSWGFVEARRLWATLSAVAACLDHVVFLGGQAIDNIQ